MKPYARKFYNSKKWKKARAAYVTARVKTDGGICERCKVKPGEEVHHIEMITPGNINNPNITLNPKNFMFVCRDCHFAIHREITFQQFHRLEVLNDKGLYFDSKGDLKQMGVKIVNGALKDKAYADIIRPQRNKQDIVIDWERIQDAWDCGLEPSTSNTWNLTDRIYENILGLIQDRDSVIDCKTVWIVTDIPQMKKVEALANRLNAEVLQMDDEHIDDARDYIINRYDGQTRQYKLARLEKYYEQRES